jgi:hypothetical protein
MRALDAKCVVSLSSLDSYQRVDPPGHNFEQAQARFFNALKVRGSRYTRFDITAPREIYRDDGHVYTFVPHAETAEWSGKPSSVTAYFIAQSEDGGRSWKFFDGDNAFAAVTASRRK